MRPLADRVRARPVPARRHTAHPRRSRTHAARRPRTPRPDSDPPRSAQVAAALRLHTLPDPPITSTVDAVNAKDRHVAAAALEAKADLVVTKDRRLRRQINQLAGRSRAVNADEFMVSLDTADPDAIDDVLAGMVAKRTRRPITRARLIVQLADAVPRFTTRTGQRDETD